MKREIRNRLFRQVESLRFHSGLFAPHQQKDYRLRFDGDRVKMIIRLDDEEWGITGYMSAPELIQFMRGAVMGVQLNAASSRSDRSRVR